MSYNIQKMYEKLKKGIPSKYIRDLELMEDFNKAKEPINQDKILGQFFDELIRMLFEFKMAFTDPFNFERADNRLKYYLCKVVKTLHFDYMDGMIMRKTLLEK